MIIENHISFPSSHSDKNSETLMLHHLTVSTSALMTYSIKYKERTCLSKDSPKICVAIFSIDTI